MTFYVGIFFKNVKMHNFATNNCNFKNVLLSELRTQGVHHDRLMCVFVNFVPCGDDRVFKNIKNTNYFAPQIL